MNSWTSSPAPAGWLLAVLPLQGRSRWHTQKALHNRLSHRPLQVLVPAPSPPCHSLRYYATPWVPLYLVPIFGGDPFIKSSSNYPEYTIVSFQDPNSPPDITYWLFVSCLSLSPIWTTRSEEVATLYPALYPNIWLRDCTM